MSRKEVLLDSSLLAQEIRSRKVEMMWFTAGWLHQLVDENIEVFDGLKTLLAGGDKLSAPHIQKLRDRYPQMQIINGYGPTENTTFSLTHNIQTVETNIPIGKPISNSTAYILDAQGRLCPIGVTGEICVGGDGLARGYLNNPGLTAEKFVTIDLPLMGETRLYKTGDLGRWSEDGDIEFLGRRDAQVKIRGYRIELGEVENALRSHPFVEEAVVIARENENRVKELVAYITGSEALTSIDLQSFLENSLPSYSIPAHFVQLEKLPLTSNGKVDKRKLPDPKGAAMSSGANYVAPRNEAEEKMALIWQSVLEKEKIGVTDSFFALGGDSIKILRMVSEAKKELGLHIPVADVYRHNTIEELVAHIHGNSGALENRSREAEELEARVKEEMDALKERILASEGLHDRDNIEDIYPMSDIERGMAFESLVSNEPGIFHDQIVRPRTIAGFDIERFRRAVQLITEKHSILRTCFDMTSFDTEVQIVYRNVEVPVHYEDLSALPRQEQEETVRRFMAAELEQRFDVTRVPLWRMAAFNLGNSEVVVVFQIHHAIIDGWSDSMLMTELNNLYIELGVNPHYRPEPLKAGYRDFIIQHEADKKNTSIKEFWQEELSGYKRLDLFTDEYEWQSHARMLDSEVRDKMNTLAAGLGVSIKDISLSAYVCMLRVLNQDTEVLAGLVTNIRPSCEDGDKILGCFLNTIPFRMAIDRTVECSEFVRQVHNKLIALKENERLSLVEIAEIHNSRLRTGNPFFDTFFNFVDFYSFKSIRNGMAAEENVPGMPALDLKGSSRSNTYLDINMNTTGGNYVVGFQLNRKLRSGLSLENLANLYFRILDHIVSNPSQAVWQADILSPHEKNQLLVEFNDVAADYPRDKTIVQLFEEQAAKTPGAIGVVFEDKELNYQELNARANQLAHYLRSSFGLQPDDLVGVKLERSEWMIVALLGVLKSSAAYVPIDPTYPQERIAYMVADSNCKLVIDEDLLESFRREEEHYSTENPASSHLQPSHLVYVIYTSGSTGRPKGVLVEHRSLVNYLFAIGSEYGMDANDRVLQTTNVAFDPAAEQIFLALLNGARLYLPAASVLADADELAAFAITNSITHLHGVPSLLRQVDLQRISSLKRVVAAGETCPVPLAANLWDKLRFYNKYGPTEATVSCVAFHVQQYPSGRSIPIGRPLSNYRIYILDEQLNLQPLGVIGEICIGGDGVARGYLNRPELTVEKFVENPFRPGERMYRTGDLGRWLEDGNIEFMGRKDEQVKVRGYRIELGEIESALQTHENIELCVVIARADKQGEKELVAYVTAKEELNIPELRRFLAGVLPAYMIPTHYVQMNELPLTSNGKVDRKSLQDIEAIGLSTGAEFVSPRNEIETKLVLIWEEVLGRKAVSVKDNFFDLGGHSLKATRLVSQVHKEFHVEIKLKELFEAPVLEDQARLIGRSATASLTMIEPVKPQEDYALSSSQRRLWVLSQLGEANVAYNVPGVYVFEGNLDRQAFEEAYISLIERHESLRTIFRESEHGEVRQVIRPHQASGCILNYFDLRNGKGRELVRDLVQDDLAYSFDLSAGPLLRASLYRVEDSKWVFSYVLHHIITDGWSMGILIKELLQLYNAYAGGEANPLIPLRIQYKDYAAWQQQQLDGKALQAHKDYWLKQLGGELPVLELLTDAPRPALKTYNGAVLIKSLGATSSAAVKSFVRGQDSSLFMGLFALVHVLMHKYTAQEDMVIGTTITGREHADLDDQVGFYVNTLALRTRFSAQDSYRELLANTRAQLMDAYTYQAYPFDELLGELKLQRDMSRNPLFDVVIELQNAEGNKMDSLNGLQVQQYGGDSKVMSKFDLRFLFVEGDDEVSVAIEYNADLYRQSTIENMGRHLQQLFAAIAADPDLPIASLKHVDASEQKQLLDFNVSQERYPAGITVLYLFEQQVILAPEQTAVIFQGTSLTYKQLDEQSNRLANYLISKYNINPGDHVALMAERSEKLIIAILAVLKAGAAYVPVDPAYPAAKREYILQNAQTRLLITESGFLLDLPHIDQQLFALDVQLDGLDTTVSAPVQHPQPRHLAYLIYTSGSTGTPKGCAITHDNLLHYIHWANRNYFTGAAQGNFGLFTSLSFDLTVTSIFCSLTRGRQLFVYDQHLDISDVLAHSFSPESGIDSIKLTPSHISMLQHMELGSSSISCAIVGGEELLATQVEVLKKINPAMEVYNEYGPTEATVGCVVYRAETGKPVLIGKPMDHASVYVLDAAGNLCGIGVAGEICIGGKGVAAGYLQQPRLTQEKFVADPFRAGERMYRSGDAGRWRSDGQLEFLGRKDEQLKIRGYRIEPGEIEVALQGCDEVETAVVMGRSVAGAEPELVAYIIGREGLSIQQLRNQLAGKLPAYMIPTHFVPLDELPLTPNGKVDRKRLPEPVSGAKKGVPYVAPRNESEQRMALAWQQVLGQEQVGIRDNFFDLGGHSLNAMKLQWVLNKEYSFRFNVRDIYNHPTIEELLTASSGNSNLVRLGAGQPQAPHIYMIPPVLGNAILYKPLADRMPEMNCFGFQYTGLERDEPLYTSIEQAAQEFSAEIMKNQEGGDFVLLGYSMGAIIAFEMARILEEQFGPIRMVLIDRPPVIRDMEKMPDKAAVNKLLEWMVEQYRILTGDAEADGEGLKRFLLNNMELMQNYQQSGKIGSDIQALECRQKRAVSMKDWADYTEGNLEHCFIEGTHWEALSPENLPLLEKAIRDMFPKA
jgi:amino acid adenylation domain-containing protein